jgi:hypothetical protein
MTVVGPNAMTAMWERDYHRLIGESPKQSSSLPVSTEVDQSTVCDCAIDAQSSGSEFTSVATRRPAKLLHFLQYATPFLTKRSMFLSPLCAISIICLASSARVEGAQALSASGLPDDLNFSQALSNALVRI